MHRAPWSAQVRDGGFTIVETLLALSIMFAVLVGLLATLVTGTRGVVTGRQRNAAVVLANEVVESARARAYNDVGHDLDSDPTLAGDPAVSGTVPDLLYTGLDPEPAEKLSASVVDAGAAAGDIANPLFPFSPHRWERPSEGTTYTVNVYVTDVTPESGDPYKRLSVIVSWDRRLTSSAIPASVRLSSFLFDAVKPSDALFAGVAEASAGRLTITGTLSGMDLSEAEVTLSYAHGAIDAAFVRRTIGHVVSAVSRLVVSSGSVTGCSADPGGQSAECAGERIDTSTDNDSGTAQPEHEASGPLGALAGSVADPDGTLSLEVDDGSLRALGTTNSCWACYGPGVDDDDGLSYQSGTVTGPTSVSVPFRVSQLLPALVVDGDLMRVGPGCAADCATVTVDRDRVGASTQLRASADVVHPAIDLVKVADRPPMVKVSGTDVRATATSGPAALTPAATGSAVEIQLYQTVPAPGYRSVTVTPGTASEHTSSASFPLAGGLASATIDATVRSNPAVTSTASEGGAVTRAEASLADWLTVSIHLVITSGPTTLADLVVDLSYGRVTTVVEYQS